jgi:hypothetical protein
VVVWCGGVCDVCGVWCAKATTHMPSVMVKKKAHGSGNVGVA